MTPFDPAPGYARIRVVHSFVDLVATPLAEGVNALCWPRVLAGDFGEVVDRLGVGEGITTIAEAQLRSLPLSAGGRTAVDRLLADQRLLRAHGLDPGLDCVNGYPAGAEPGPVRTDVCSFHADSATAETDTWLCTYHGAASEGLRNEEAVRRVDIPATRAALRREYGGADDAGFLSYLGEHFYDLHYAPLPGARPYGFGVGNLWRIATQWPGCPVPPCIHRAPDPVPGQPRLLLIA